MSQEIYICANRDCERLTGECPHFKKHKHLEGCNLTCGREEYECILVQITDKIIISKSTAKSTREYMRNK